ncbi:iron ABC transporter permease [Chelativorans sp. SCAU2101]|jgi:ABC-type Fe3+ transport system, permease component|uniref:Iron ABC transporter permease n=1 Tax=Chelativorans petroleitrophicus TaxID=2975484 RepID=A0A9X2X760_9HYPH|nr:iron ABC transporter permease [Chelativorans petroleitrophicus]MCT8989913.1 iron ABC transporter permease [Chelativorans petroleitrophicus]
MTIFALRETVPSPAAPALRTRAQRHPLAMAVAVLVAGLVLLPIAATLVLALSGTGADWPHLARYVLPQAATTTLVLLLLVGCGTAFVGVGTAWLVIAYEFPLRRVLAWALVMPLAVPPYLAAYAHDEFFHYVGPVQTLLRSIFGFERPSDYWFPDIRSTTGAALVLTSVTFPYVYLTARFIFLMQGRNIADVARTLGAAPARVFWRVLLPVARPAIVAGVALVMMETINDFGAVEHLGVRTMTLAIYSTWLNRGSLEGAAQIAVVMLVLVLLLIAAERIARRRQRFHASRGTQMNARPPRIHLSGWRGLLATALGLTPILFGFGIPLFIFGRYALNRLHQATEPALSKAFLTSLGTGFATAVLTVGIALLLIYAARLSRRRSMAILVRFAAIGYAMPGTILALGLLISLARFDNFIDALAREYVGFSTGLILTGSATAVVLACTIRFLALAEGAIQAGLDKLPPHLDEAARSLGRSAPVSAATVLLPLLKPAVLTAGILVFVDTVKELSATILLRPFGFRTLATYVHENAARGAVEDGAMAALLIIATATVPVILLSGSLTRDRDA